MFIQWGSVYCSSAIASVHHTDKRLSMDYARRISIGLCNGFLRLGCVLFWLVICNQSLVVRVEKRKDRENGLISKGEKCRESWSLVGFLCVCGVSYFGDRSLTLIIYIFSYSWQPYSFFFRGGGLLNKCGTFERKYAARDVPIDGTEVVRARVLNHPRGFILNIIHLWAEVESLSKSGLIPAVSAGVSHVCKSLQF